MFEALLSPRTKDGAFDVSEFCYKFRLTPQDVHFLRCTAEHLIARCEGGIVCTDNIVAACFYCNQHRRQAEEYIDYKKSVVNAVENGTNLHYRRIRELRDLR